MSKPDDNEVKKADYKPDTRFSIGGRDPFAHHGYVNTPVYHASTLLYRTAEDYLAHRRRYQYGRRGTPTSPASPPKRAWISFSGWERSSDLMSILSVAPAARSYCAHEAWPCTAK